jgi:hypothetical protein
VRCSEAMATGTLKFTDAPSPTEHAADLHITATDMRTSSWFHEGRARRWTIDPTEWDDAYANGVERIEASLAVAPSTWHPDWIAAHTTRCAALIAACPVAMPRTL